MIPSISDEIPLKPFSKRSGYSGAPKEITVREDAPQKLRYFLRERALELGLDPDEIVCNVLHEWPDNEIKLYSCEWFYVYDIIERIFKQLKDIDRVQLNKDRPSTRASDFENSINDFFLEEGIGWQLMDGEIRTRGPESFEWTVRSAIAELDATGRVTARREIDEALRDLSRRPIPDLTGGIQHAMVALECVARDLTGDNKATLGDVLKKYRGVIPKPLDTAVEKAWGYACEMGRHLQEGREPNRREVELVVGIAAAVTSYLATGTSAPS